MKIAEALRLIRAREGLSQIEASKRQGAPNPKTLSHWECGYKTPRLELVYRYLRSLGLDLCDLQGALNLVGERSASCRERIDSLEMRIGDMERRLGLGESTGPKEM